MSAENTPEKVTRINPDLQADLRADPNFPLEVVDEVGRLLEARTFPLDRAIAKAERNRGRSLMSNGELAVPDVPLTDAE